MVNHNPIFPFTSMWINPVRNSSGGIKPRCSRRPRGPLARREQRGIIFNGVKGSGFLGRPLEIPYVVNIRLRALLTWL
jgi:hypothetical protein